MAFAVQHGINMLQVGALRMPALFASCSGALIVGELAYRATRTVLATLGFDGSKGVSKFVYENTPEFVGKIIRPFRNEKEYPVKTLVIYGVAACVIGAIGTDLVKLAFGAPPAIYNQVLTYMGPIRITDSFHPATQYVMNRFFS